MRNLFAEICIYLTISFSVIFFGSVSFFAFLTLSGSCFLVFLLLFEGLDDLDENPRFIRVCFLLLALWIAIQSLFFSIDPSRSLFQILKWLAMVSIFIAFQKLTYQQIIRIMTFVLIFSILLSLYALFEVYSGHEHVLWEQKKDHLNFLTATFRNRNHFAGFLQLGLGSGLGLMMRSLSKKKMIHFLMQLSAVFFLVIVLVKTGSRSGLTCFVMALSFFGVLLLKKKTLAGTLFMTLSIISIVVGIYFGYDVFSLRMNELSVDLPSLEGRLSAWKNVLEMASFFFWKGCGLGNFAQVFPAFQSAEIVYGWQHAHQDYLELLIEIGSVGFVLLLSLIGAFFYLCISKALKKKESSMYLVIGALMGCLSLALHGLMDFNFAVPANGYCFIVFLSIAWRLCKFQKKVYIVKKKKHLRSGEE